MSTLDEIRARNDNQMRMGHRFAPGSVIDDRRTLLALLDAQSLELQAVREALAECHRLIDFVANHSNARRLLTESCLDDMRAALKQSRGAT